MKRGIALLLMIIPLFALTVQVPEQVVYPEGNVGTFTVFITNEGSENASVDISVTADIPVTLSENHLVLLPNESRTIYVFALTKGLAPDTYPITLNISGVIERLAVIVPAEASPLSIYSEYRTLEVTQGYETTFKVLVSNEGDQLIRNIIIKTTIPGALEPSYEGPIDLLPGESREVEITFKVPEGYPTGTYEFYIYAESGSLSAEDKIDVKILEKVPLSEMLDVSVGLPWEKLEKDGAVIGYKIPIIVENRGPSTIRDLHFEVTAPSGWDVSAPTFNITGHEQKTIYLDIVPSDFSEKTLTVVLVQNGEKVKALNITVAGYKIGITGFALGGGSIIVGVLVAALIIAAILFVRQRNIYKDQIEKAKREAYLNSLTKKLNE